jgi:transcriptional regulator with XRE-family HTH domain
VNRRFAVGGGCNRRRVHRETFRAEARLEDDVHIGTDARPPFQHHATAEVLPAGVLRSPAMRDAGDRRDIGEIFRLARRDAGLSISRMARLCDMTPSRVGAYVRGTSRVRDQRVIERVADGLRIPGEMLGLRSRPWEDAPAGPFRESRTGGPACAAPSGADAASPRVPEPAAVRLRLPPSALLAEVATGIEVELGPGGRPSVTYRHNVVNTTGRPIDRLTRSLTFPAREGTLAIVPLPGSAHDFTIEDLDDAGTFATFTCRMTKPIRPGDVAVIAYRCSSTRYVRDHGEGRRASAPATARR